MRTTSLLFLTSLVASLAGIAPAQVIVSYAQLSYDLGGTPAPHTDWGSLTVTYTSRVGVDYLNLNVNGRWAVRNVPMLATGPGEQRKTIDFGIGVPRGTNIVGQTHRVALTLTEARAGDPGVGAATIVGAQNRRLNSGISGGTATLENAPPSIEYGGTIVSWEAHQGFPNRPAGPNECVPAAVSNSLMFLKETNPNAAWGNLPVDLATMKRATRWTSGGTGTGWPSIKDQYMRDPNHRYPVDTRWTTDPAEAYRALGRGCDVELTAWGNSGHCAAVVGMGKTSTGEWIIKVAHDVCQENRASGECQLEQGLCLDSSGILIGESSQFYLKRVLHFTIECVSECFLMLGTERAHVALLGNPDDVALLVPLVWWPVTLSSVPDLPIPGDPRLLGLALYFQVVMHNPAVFPDDPLQLTNGLEAVIGGGEPGNYGRETGMRIWAMGSTQPGGVLRVRFSMPGQ